VTEVRGHGTSVQVTGDVAIKPAFTPSDDFGVWFLDFLGDFLIDFWCQSRGTTKGFRAERRRARQREREFAATQVAVARWRAETPSAGLDYFADRPGDSSLGD
jgi:hypothetical protein